MIASPASLYRSSTLKRSSIGLLITGLLTALAVPVTRAAETSSSTDHLAAWPSPTETNHPWTRWWWLGNAVDKPNIDRLLTDYHDAGIGGVEICPIYGAKGYEKEFIDYLSPKWIQVFGDTTSKASQLGMGVDLTTGTGWPFGGPWVSRNIASSEIIRKEYSAANGASISEKLPQGRLQCVIAYGPDGKRVDLTSTVQDSELRWTAPDGNWHVYALVQHGPIQKVKRAAPGGQGNVLDPYSTHAMDEYLARFSEAFKNYHGKAPRSEFQDSYEYFGADWTNDFFQEFKQRRGYDLRDELPAFFGKGPDDVVARVKCDYRETMAELNQAYDRRWTEWSHEHGSMTRLQAHGSPTNLEDTYAIADIPETEIFRGPSDNQIPMIGFASSAAHVTGRSLASSETFTWLGEHFQVTLADLKPELDFLYLAGINHMFFQGIPYSPKSAPWPGWQFYASVNFGPEGGLWHDLPAFNAYATRCQSILQAGKPDNNVLLYYPVFDFWQLPGNDTVILFKTPGRWMWGSVFHDTAMKLWNEGFSYDQVTDHFISKTTFDGKSLTLGGNHYKAIVIPNAKIMPVATLRNLVDLAQKGATVIFQDSLPTEVPGLNNYQQRQAHLHGILNGLHFTLVNGTDIRKATVGNGQILLGGDAEALLTEADVPRETMADLGLRFIRRLRPDGVDYFIVNHGDKPVDSWVTLATPARSAAILDPRFADRIGLAALRHTNDGATQVFLQLKPGESRFLRTSKDGELSGPKWAYEKTADASPTILSGTWKVHFLQGGPVLPQDYSTSTLKSWTTRNDKEAKRFAGTARYTLDFNIDPSTATDWLLDLGKVCDSARVTINGKKVGTLWSKPFRVRVGTYLKPGRNEIQIDVTNIAANRIRDLDRRHVNWKYFYEINFVNREYKPFDASNWTLRDSGLLGPVKLIPLTTANFSASTN